MPISNKELIELVNKRAINERLQIVEAVLKNIREEEKTKDIPNILDFAGIFEDKEAAIFEETINESRKIENLELF